ncbi:hypothetical protein H4R18_005788 [Coemansia javaensis]|uniref:tRNA (cytosine(38)-C(5))-methyltransferase n=1 Tax=Coemansia javaensis TaxID=2761396 RepID=A0A9W8H0J6_9FUNG|nr:hypothetical protein H4R18_005788 [Coemansia javaensis]
MDADQQQRQVVCLEFFSGIGGLHYGLLESGVGGRVAMSWDMNENANAVYSHNFGRRPSNKAIDYLTAQDIDMHRADCWLLSPPCQPYTRGGNYRDCDDPRARGLLRLLDLLPRVAHRPTHVFVENVMNFENSRSRVALVTALGGLGFEIVECLVSPVQFGIPNSRLRYFLAARCRWAEPRAGRERGALDDGDDGARAAWAAENSQRTAAYLARGRAAVHTSWPFGPAAATAAGAEIALRPLRDYIDPACDADPALRVPAADIAKRRRPGLDIVTPASRCTATFTKAYGSSHLLGSGSLLQTAREPSAGGGAPQTETAVAAEAAGPERLLGLGLRFFSPDEVARLHHFPQALEFPACTTQRQRLQLLGNSLNVHVVAQLLRHVLFSASAWGEY